MGAIAIYALHDIEGNIKYVGKTIHLRSRFKDHCQKKAWVIGIKVLEWATEKNWRKLERKWISKFGLNNLENIHPGGWGITWHEPISKIKIGLANLGNTKGFQKGNKLNLGRVWTEESKRKSSNSMKGKPAWNKGIELSSEYKEKIRQGTRVAITKWWAERKLKKVNLEN